MYLLATTLIVICSADTIYFIDSKYFASSAMMTRSPLATLGPNSSIFRTKMDIIYFHCCIIENSLLKYCLVLMKQSDSLSLSPSLPLIPPLFLSICLYMTWLVFCPVGNFISQRSLAKVNWRWFYHCLPSDGNDTKLLRTGFTTFIQFKPIVFAQEIEIWALFITPTSEVRYPLGTHIYVLNLFCYAFHCTCTLLVLEH